MGHKHSVLDADAHFTIDPITRMIKNESSKKTTIIQFDHNSERFSFSLERFVEKHDMMLCTAVEVHFTNTDSKTGDFNADYYEVEDLQIDPVNSNKIVFSWLIDERATQYAGSLEFSIKFKCIENGVCVYRWNTANNNEISVSSGRDNSGAVVEIVASVVDQWRSQIFGDAENAVANINLAEKNSIEAVQEAGEDILNAANTAEQNAKNVLANAIIGSLSGEVVTADDVSPVEHEMVVKVLPKNFVPLGYSTKSEEIERQDDGGVAFVSDGILSGDYREIRISTNGDSKVYLGKGTYAFKLFNAPIGAFIIVSGKTIPYQEGTSGIFTVAEDGYMDYIIVRFAAGYSYDCVVYPMICKDETPTEYTPYIDPATVTVSRCGKNILGYTDDFEITQNGLTISYDSTTRIFTVNGTPDSASFSINFGSHLFDTFAFPVGTDVALSIEHISGTLTAESMTNVFYLGNSDSAGGGRNNWFSIPFPISGRKTNVSTATRKYFTRTWLYIGGENDVTFTDYKFKVQLEVGTEATDYEEFAGVKYTPDAEGAVLGMTALSPNMVILSDKSGVVVECEYIKDTNKVIEKLVNAIVALGGTV